MVQKREEKRRHLAGWLGGSVFVLAAVGLVTILSLLVGLVGNLIESTRKETEFERLIAPLVMLDPPSFDDPSKLSNQMLLQSSMWSVLLNTDTSQYAIDEYDRMTIPASDVDVQCAKLYGAQVHLEHMTFGGIESPFLYDAEGQRYYVPITGQSNVYTPKVEKIEREGDIYTLTVGYVPPAYGWAHNVRGKDYEPRPQKYMLYRVQAMKKSWQILSVGPVPVTEEAPAAPGTPPEEEPAAEGAKT
ncbi:MAG: hypothetical protein HFJ86_06915 [Oscillospiraceae bacterium]|jgi:hypothetical protein|nr:hypothetical protein [Oscillospiraceae bacterium]